ncbi:MAG: GAF domain-containing protein [Armatimonadetes bacterium]|nr:GAF domain-containing protein [Armatimonadota bacterium]
MAQLRAELAEAKVEADALHRVSEAIASAGDIDQMLDVVAKVAISVTGTEACFIYLRDEISGDLTMRALAGEDPSVVGKIRLHAGEGVTGWVAREMKTLVIPEKAWKDARFKAFPELGEERFESFLSVPIVAKNRTIGVINVRTRQPLEYTPGQIHLLETIAGQVAGAIELARLHHASLARATQLSAISEVSKTVTSNLYLEEVLQLIVAMTAETMNLTLCSIMLTDRDREELVIKASTSESALYREKPNVRINESVAGRAILSGQPVTIRDVRKAPGYQYVDVARQEGLCSLICVPLAFQERTIGVLNCYTSRPHDFTEEETRLLTTLGQQAAIAIENSKLMVKSAIIQEMHHRIKNNLQTIASLLRLEMRSSPDNPEEVLRESISRIQSIAAVHDLLSREDLDAVSFKKIAESIMSGAHQNMIHPGQRVETRISGDDLMLPSAQATAMALILNELIANAVEHGMDADASGSIEVSLQVRGKRGMTEVRNTGAPLPPGFDLTRSNSLGLKIVESLSRESLGGGFTLVTEGEATVGRIVFTTDWPVD